MIKSNGIGKPWEKFNKKWHFTPSLSRFLGNAHCVIVIVIIFQKCVVKLRTLCNLIASNGHSTMAVICTADNVYIRPSL